MLLLLCRLTGLVIWVLIDNLNVVRSIGRLLDADCLAKPLPLVKDGDLVALVQYMIRTRGRDTVRVTKVKGHAHDDDVQHGHVRLLDQQGNVEADFAADLGRRHQTELLIDARRRLLQVRSYWYPIMTDLHRFIIAIARVSVNHDGKGGTAPDPLVWDQGSKPRVRKLAIRVNVDLASLPGPPGFLNNTWIQVDAGHIASADTSAWPYSVAILVRFTSFLGILHWPSGSVDLGHDGISFFWNISSFSNSGLVTGCLVKRLLDLMFELVVLFWFPLFLFQREWKFDMGVSLSAVLLGRWVSFLVGWVGSYLVRLVLTCPGCVI